MGDLSQYSVFAGFDKRWQAYPYDAQPQQQLFVVNHTPSMNMNHMNMNASAPRSVNTNMNNQTSLLSTMKKLTASKKTLLPVDVASLPSSPSSQAKILSSISISGSLPTSLAVSPSSPPQQSQLKNKKKAINKQKIMSQFPQSFDESTSPPPIVVQADDLSEMAEGVRQMLLNKNKNKPSQFIEQELSQQNLYKTELCRSFEETGSCRYGLKCQFAHGRHELRPVLRHPKYKTEPCKTWQTIGTCPYGTRCRFLHAKEDEDGNLIILNPGPIVPSGRRGSFDAEPQHIAMHHPHPHPHPHPHEEEQVAEQQHVEIPEHEPHIPLGSVGREDSKSRLRVFVDLVPRVKTVDADTAIPTQHNGLPSSDEASEESDPLSHSGASNSPAVH